jgi:hypothetical protein
MKIQRFFGSGAALLRAALAAAALLALVGCSGSNNNTATPTLVSITAETTKDGYLVGQDLELDTITVTGTYSDGSTKVVPITGVNIADYDKTQAGEQTITVTVGVKTATFTVTVTAPPVNAQAPTISGQPQGGTFGLDEAVTLSVTAASPDGGTLSYQWHSAASGSSGWTAIEGATGASYVPSTAAEGSVSYYARVTNTNNEVTGNKSAGINSATVTVTVSPVPAGTPGSGVFAFTAWVSSNDDRLVSDMPDDLVRSRSLGESLVITAAADLASIQWSINGVDLEAPRGTASVFTLEAAAYPTGNYTLGLWAKQGNIPYSINFTVTVDN